MKALACCFVFVAAHGISGYLCGMQLAEPPETVVAPADTADTRAPQEDKHKPSKFSVKLVERVGSARFQHGAVISQLWFPTNEQVVSYGGRTFRLWNAKTGELQNKIQCPQRSRPTFGLGRRVLIPEPLVNGVPTQMFRVEDLATGKPISRWLHPEWSVASAISRGGKFAVLGNLAHTISIVDVQTGHQLDRIEQLALRSNRGGYPNVMLSPDDRVLAVLARPDHIQFFELAATGEIQKPLATIDDQTFYKLVFSQKRDEVLLIGRRSSAIWNVRNGKQTVRWDEPDINPVSDAVFAKQGRIVAELTDVADGIIRVRDTQSGKQLRSFPLNADPTCIRIGLSPDESVLAAGGYQQCVRLYDFATGKQIQSAADVTTDGPVESVAISDDGNWIASATYKGLVSLWDAKNGWKRTIVRDDDIRSKFRFDTSAGPNFLAFLPGESKLLAGSGIYHNSLNVWDAATAERDERLVGHSMPIIGVAASRDGAVLASTGRDHALRVWDRDGTQRHEIRADSNSLALSPDGSLVAVCVHREDHTLSRDSIPEPPIPIPAIELWSTESRKLVRSFAKKNGAREIGYGFYSVSFSHDGRLVAGIANEGLHVWESANGKLLRLIPVPRPAADLTAWHAPNCGCAFSPTENVIAVPTAEGSIVFLDLDSESNEPIAVLKGHDGPVNSVSWQRNGRYLVSGGNDATIALWQIR